MEAAALNGGRLVVRQAAVLAMQAGTVDRLLVLLLLLMVDITLLVLLLLLVEILREEEDVLVSAS